MPNKVLRTQTIESSSHHHHIPVKIHQEQLSSHLNKDLRLSTPMYNVHPQIRESQTIKQFQTGSKAQTQPDSIRFNLGSSRSDTRPLI